MFRNYFKTAIRSLLKNKTASFINITGLCIGLTCCLLMVLYIQHELSYDRFHTNGDRIVRVIMEYRFNDGQLNKGNYTSTKVFPSFQRNFPEVENGVRIMPTEENVRYADKLFSEKAVLYADSTFFSIFSFRLQKGKADEVLKAPQMVVLSQSAAQKYFGEEDPVGKSIQLGNRKEPFVITGIAEDCPAASQIKFDFVVSFSSLHQPEEDTYFNANYTTYLLLKSESDIARLQQKIGPFMQKEVQVGYDPGTYINFELEPMTKIHLYSAYDAIEPNGNIRYIYIIGAVALLVLTIACFTYINLGTARSLERAKEVGIRKVAGAYRGQLFSQFISESFITVLIAAVLSMLLAIMLLPAFNSISAKQLQPSQLLQPAVMGGFAVIVLVIALLAGSYPALMLTKFKPVLVLKGSFKNTSSGSLLRKSLIVFQFAVSAFLIAATFIIKGQLNYIQEKKLGYNREHVLVTTIDQKTMGMIETLKTELKKNGSILAVSNAHSTPVRINGGYSVSTSEAVSSEMSVKGCPVDDEYVNAAGLEILAGSNLSRQDLLDANKEDYNQNYFHYILNESAARALGWKPADAIGKKMYLGSQRPGEVKAVVKDFHFASLHSPIEPLVLFPGGWGNKLLVKITGSNLPGTVSYIEKSMKSLAPQVPFEYRFMDDDFNRLYQAEQRTGTVFSLFALIAILLACLGLFGLSAYAARQRMKEIGVRKVLGASAAQIVLLLSGSFLQLTFIAFAIALPAAWYGMQRWLNDFAYRINISWFTFVLTALFVVTITLLTVGIQAIKAAWLNPVKTLRTE